MNVDVIDLAGIVTVAYLAIKYLVYVPWRNRRETDKNQAEFLNSLKKGSGR